MPALARFLSDELAPRPGRLAFVLRITALTVLTVLLSEVFRVPLTAYSAYIVFFISKEESASTVLTGIVVTLAITLSIAATIAIYMISAGEPGLRLPLMAVAVFAGMFLSRVSTLGIVGFVIGFLITVSLTLADAIPDLSSLPRAELLTQTLLWLWVVVMLPVGVVVAGNLLAGRGPDDLFEAELSARRELAARVRANREIRPADGRAVAAYVEAGPSALLEALKAGGIFRQRPAREQAAAESRVAQAAKLMSLTAAWIELDDPAGEGLLSARLDESARALAGSQSGQIAPGEPESGREPRRLLAPDAFSNPDHLRFALKTTLAVFVAYAAYNLLDWPGIRTCMITCFFVALASFGETAQKMTLRMTGAIIGGALGLATVVFVMPFLTTITSLCLIIAAVSFAAAWVATSSERLSYAGLQIAMAFFFSTLVGYGPSIELTFARDRFVGVLLGNAIVYAVFSAIWPVRALDRARASLAAALDALARALTSAAEDSGRVRSELAFAAGVAQARRLASLDPFEPRRIEAGAALPVNLHLIEAAQALEAPAILAADGARRDSFAAWLARASKRLASGDRAASLEAPPRLDDGAGFDDLAFWRRELDRRAARLGALLNEEAGSAA